MGRGHKGSGEGRHEEQREGREEGKEKGIGLRTWRMVGRGMGRRETEE